jgi:hypothetical protein
VQFGHRRALADAELDAPVADEIEGRDALGHPRRVVRRQLHDPMAETNPLGALTGGGEEDFGRRGVRVLLEEVVLDLPHRVVAEAVGELDLLERALQQAILAVLVPGARKLVLIEDSELHGSSTSVATSRPCAAAATCACRGRRFRVTLLLLHYSIR